MTEFENTSNPTTTSDAPETNLNTVQEKLDTHMESLTPTSEPAAKANTDWMNMLSSEIKDSTYLNKFKDKSLDDVIKAGINAEKLIGKKVEDYAAEDITRLYNKLGRPESPTDYSFSAELHNFEDMSEIFHSAGLNQSQARSIADQLVERQRHSADDSIKMDELRFKEAERILREDFGEAYDNRLKLAKNTVLEFGGEELLSYLNDSGLGMDPHLIKAFAKMGKTFGEDRLLGSEQKQTFGITPDEAQLMIASKKKDSDFMEKYMGKGKYRNSPEHKSALAEMTELFKFAHSNKK